MLLLFHRDFMEPTKMFEDFAFDGFDDQNWLLFAGK
jgi:hypothetical protein